MISAKSVIVAAIVLLLAFMGISESLAKSVGAKTDLNEEIYYYLKDKSNQESTFKAAESLNNNSPSNACVFFMSEVLRRNGVQVPENTANTSQLLSILKDKGFSKGTDYRNLEPGDIVFTTDEHGNRNGIPSHTYVFMKWVKEGSYDYAYVCDNQAKDYNNQIYHIRNIKTKDNVNGITKDAFSFFMKLE